jgi:hypothetical protein
VILTLLTYKSLAWITRDKNNERRVELRTGDVYLRIGKMVLMKTYGWANLPRRYDYKEERGKAIGQYVVANISLI